MSTNVYESGGLIVTIFAGPARNDRADRRFVQINQRMDIGYRDDAETCILTIHQVDALLDWIERDPEARAQFRPLRRPD